MQINSRSRPCRPTNLRCTASSARINLLFELTWLSHQLDPSVQVAPSFSFHSSIKIAPLSSSTDLLEYLYSHPGECRCRWMCRTSRLDSSNQTLSLIQFSHCTVVLVSAFSHRRILAHDGDFLGFCGALQSVKELASTDWYKPRGERPSSACTFPLTSAFSDAMVSRCLREDRSRLDSFSIESWTLGLD